MKARYNSEEEIIALIDKCHRNSQRAVEQAAAIKEQYTAEQLWFVREFPNPESVRLEQHRQSLIALKSKKERLEKYAFNQVYKKAVKLGEKLAEMRTTFLKFNKRDSKVLRATDRSVPSI